MELKERGIAGAVIQMAEKCHAADRCIVFSGMDEVVWEIQDWCRSHKKPEGLRLGADIRFLKDEQKELLDSGNTAAITYFLRPLFTGKPVQAAARILAGQYNL